jgi:hypothetical protein
MLETFQSLQRISNEDDHAISSSGYTVSSIQRAIVLAGTSAVKETFEISLGRHEPLALQDLPSHIFVEDYVLVFRHLLVELKLHCKKSIKLSHSPVSVIESIESLAKPSEIIPRK